MCEDEDCFDDPFEGPEEDVEEVHWCAPFLWFRVGCVISGVVGFGRGFLTLGYGLR